MGSITERNSSIVCVDTHIFVERENKWPPVTTHLSMYCVYRGCVSSMTIEVNTKAYNFVFSF